MSTEHFYVQLDSNNIVVGASALAGPVNNESLRQTAIYRPDLIGMRCVGEDQYEPVTPEPESAAQEQP